MLILFTLLLFQETVPNELQVDYVERVTVVRLPLMVSHKGAPYKRLKKERLTLTENGTHVNVDGVQEVETPVVLQFLFDLSTSNERYILQAKRAARDIINKMKPLDMARISFFSGNYQPLTDYTSDKKLLQNKIEFLSSVGSTALYDGISSSIEDLSRQKGVRMLILFSDGHDLLSATKEGELMNKVNYFKIPMVFAAFPSRRKSELLKGQYNFMQSLARQSGGRTIPSTSDVARSLVKEIKERRKRYLISFTPPDPDNVKLWRSLVVEIKECPDCKLEYRRAYQIEK